MRGQEWAREWVVVGQGGEQVSSTWTLPPPGTSVTSPRMTTGGQRCGQSLAVEGSQPGTATSPEERRGALSGAAGTSRSAQGEGGEGA